jgi:hypothetical protein
MATRKAFQGENYKRSGEYVGNYNGGRSEVQEMTSTLKRRNVRSMAGNSSYIGKRVLLIHNNDLEKAVKVLKEFYPKHYATELAANLKRDVDTDKKMGVFESGMKNLMTFENYSHKKAVFGDFSKKDQEQIDYFIEKFATKMGGTTRQSAAWWVDGITEISDDIKRAVWAGIQEYIPKRPFPLNKADLPEWTNESELKDDKADETHISLTEDDFRALVAGEIITPEDFPPHLDKLKLALQDIGQDNMIRIITDEMYKARKAGDKNMN